MEAQYYLLKLKKLKVKLIYDNSKKNLSGFPSWLHAKQKYL